MGVKNEKFQYYGGSPKNPIFKGWGSQKLIYRGELCKTGGLGQFADLMGDLARKREEGVFERGVDTRMHTMNNRWTQTNILCKLGFSVLLFSSWHLTASLYYKWVMSHKGTLVECFLDFS